MDNFHLTVNFLTHSYLSLDSKDVKKILKGFFLPRVTFSGQKHFPCPNAWQLFSYHFF